MSSPILRLLWERLGCWSPGWRTLGSEDVGKEIGALLDVSSLYGSGRRCSRAQERCR